MFVGVLRRSPIRAVTGPCRGGMFAFNVVPNERHCARLPSFADDPQLRRLLPLSSSLLAGATAHKCGEAMHCADCRHSCATLCNRTSLHAAQDGNCMIPDAVPLCSHTDCCACYLRSHMPLAAAMAAAAETHRKFGNVLPRTMLPFVVEHAGGISKEGMECF